MSPQFVQSPMEQYEPDKSSMGWPWRLFTVVSIIFSITIVSYLGLIFGYRPYLESKIQEKSDKIDQLAESISKEDQEQFIRFHSQLVNLKGLLDNHALTSKIFPLLERITHREVYYISAGLEVPRRELQLSGVAKSYAVLAEQLEIFNQAEEIESYIINQAGASRNLVDFRVVLKLKSKILTNNQPPTTNN